MTAGSAALLLACAWVGALLGLHIRPPVGWLVIATAVALIVAAVAAIGMAVRARAPGSPPSTADVRGAPGPQSSPSSAGMPATAFTAPSGLRSRLLVGLLCLPVLLTTMTGAGARAATVHGGPLRTLAEAPVAVDLVLVAVEDARDPPEGRRWLVARVQSAAPAGRAALPSRERVLLRLPDTADITFGGTYAVRGRASVLRPGPATAHFHGIGVTVQVDAVDVTERDPPPRWQSATTHIRDRLGDAARRHLDPAAASLLTGLVTGDLRGQPEHIADAIVASGLSHLVAVSGSTVALVVAGVLALAALLRLGRRAGWWICLVAIWWFAVLVRLQPSVVRAGAMASLVLAAMLVGRVRRTPALLCVAGITALLVDPMLAGRLGFVLSMAATAGVVLLMPPLAAWVTAHSPLPRWGAMAVAATCGAQVAVTPVLIGVGGVVHLSSLPANLLAVPAAVVAKVVGGAVALLAIVAPEVAGVVAVAAVPVLRIILWSAETFASPGGQRATVVVATMIAVAASMRAWAHLPVRMRRAAPAVALGIGVAVLGVPGGGSGSTGPIVPSLTMLDVGQGDALLLGDPEGGWVLVDGGPDPSRVLDLLADEGIGALAAVVVSHPHLDHTGGLPAVLSALDVGAVVVGPLGMQAVEVIAAARGTGTPVVTVAEGDRWQHGGMTMTVLSPPPTGLGSDPNDNSLVVRVDVSGGGRSVLLTGDAEVLPQRLLSGDPLLDVDVLKVPHHGGATNDPGFLASTTPSHALISAGADNAFGHPHPDVLADLEGTTVSRTDIDGTVVVPLREE